MNDKSASLLSRAPFVFMFAMAMVMVMTLGMAAPVVDTSPLRGVEPITDDLLYYDARQHRLTQQRPPNEERALSYHDAGTWLEPDEFADYRVVMIATLGSDARDWTEQDVERVRAWVEEGNTLIFAAGSVYRLAGSRRNLSLLEPLLGGAYYGTPSDFEPRVLAPDHPLVRHMDQPWAWTDPTRSLGRLSSAQTLVGTDDEAMVAVNGVGRGRVIYLGPQLTFIRDMPNRAAITGVIRRAIEDAGLRAVGRDRIADAEPAFAFFGEGRGRLSLDWLIENELESWQVAYSPVSLLLSKYTYPAEDGHLDAVIWLDEEQGDRISHHPKLDSLEPTQRDASAEGMVELAIRDDEGRALLTHTLEEVVSHQLFVSFDLPEGTHGQPLRFEVMWRDMDGEVIGRKDATFHIDPPQHQPETAMIPLRIANHAQVRGRGIPVTLGVPFPRGVLHDPERVRLVDESRRELPLQVKPTGYWSRFGSIRWLLCDFAVDLDGEPRTVYLEFGPDVQPDHAEPIAVEMSDGAFPHIEMDRLRVDEQGIAWDAQGDGHFELAIPASGLTGAFVEREDGTVYVPADEGEYEIEAHGSEKVIVRRRGWYRDAAGDDAFCQYDIRWYFYRHSPVVRIEHTWLYTGDSNRESDRIRNMGWRFDMVDGATSEGFLTAFDESGRWRQGEYLLQHAHDAFKIIEGDQAWEGTRAPGVLSASLTNGRVHLGSKDFWQNFPSEIAFEDGAMIFYQWPRHGRPRSDESATRENAWRLDFAHSGEVMDLSLPMEYVEGPIYDQASERGHHFRQGVPDSVNAQGVAKTTEMWLYFDAQNDLVEAQRVLEALDGELMRAVVDPAWLYETRAMHEIYPHDPEKFPEEERIYELYAYKPMRQMEHMGVYGMWIWGNMLHAFDLEEHTANLYRAFRKSHHAWPYSWIPFARSGDPAYFKFAEAGTRMMVDVAFCHYFDDELAAEFEERDDIPYFRAIGWWNRNLIPWAGFRGPTTRMYADSGEYLWHAWHLTGYRRAKEVNLAWAEQTKREDRRYGRGGGRAAPSDRGQDNLQQQYIEMYQNTFDPWFLVAAHALADLQEARLERDGWGGRNWRMGHREFHRFVGRGDYDKFFFHSSEHLSDQRTMPWASRYIPQVEPAAFAYRITGDAHYLRRVVGEIDYALSKTYTDPDGPLHYLGHGLNSVTAQDVGYTGWFIQRFPYALAALAAAGERPEPLPKGFHQGVAEMVEATIDDERVFLHRVPPILIHKEANREVPIHLRVGRFGDDVRYRIIGPSEEVVVEGGIDAEATVMLDRVKPAGVYTLLVEGPMGRNRLNTAHPYSPWLMIPVTPPGVGEVLAIGSDRTVPRGHWFSQYWFKVGEDVDQFSMEFAMREPFREDGRRIAIWNSEGELAWDWQRLSRDYAGEEYVRAEVSVLESMRGRIWQVTLPGRNFGFTFDPAISPYFAHSPDRWFEPDVSDIPLQWPYEE